MGAIDIDQLVYDSYINDLEERRDVTYSGPICPGSLIRRDIFGPNMFRYVTCFRAHQRSLYTIKKVVVAPNFPTHLVNSSEEIEAGKHR